MHLAEIVNFLLVNNNNPCQIHGGTFFAFFEMQ